MANQGDLLATDAEVAEGHVRLRKALGGLDRRTGEILALHIALEVEIDLTFEELFPRPAYLKGFGFSGKVRVLQAIYNDVIIDIIAEPLLAFDRLRNSIAHRHQKREINANFRKVCELLQLDPATATVPRASIARRSSVKISAMRPA